MAKIVQREISHEKLLRQFSYDPEEGIFYYRKSWGRAKAGMPAGRVHRGSTGKPYLDISFEGSRILAHRLAWFYVHKKWPKDELDHEDGDGLNNKFRNLKERSHAENMRNMSLRVDNLTGIIGVSFAYGGKFKAGITYQRKQIHLGTFEVLADAAQARKDAEVLYGFHASHGKIQIRHTENL